MKTKGGLEVRTAETIPPEVGVPNCPRGNTSIDFYKVLEVRAI